MSENYIENPRIFPPSEQLEIEQEKRNKRVVTCPRCSGSPKQSITISGKTYDYDCGVCSGTGEVTVGRLRFY